MTHMLLNINLTEVQIFFLTFAATLAVAVAVRFIYKRFAGAKAEPEKDNHQL